MSDYDDATPEHDDDAETFERDELARDDEDDDYAEDRAGDDEYDDLEPEEQTALRAQMDREAAAWRPGAGSPIGAAEAAQAATLGTIDEQLIALIASPDATEEARADARDWLAARQSRAAAERSAAE